LGKLLLLLKNRNFEEFNSTLFDLKKRALQTLAATSMEGYSRAYDSVLQLSILQEVSEFNSNIVRCHDNSTAEVLKKTLRVWECRLNSMGNTFKTRESFLNLRRIMLSILPDHTKLSLEVPFTVLQGRLWTRSAKEARKAEYHQTSYSSILQSLSLGYGMAFYEQAKSLWSQNQKDKAISQIDYALKRNLLSSTSNDCVEINPQLEEAKVYFDNLGNSQTIYLAGREKRATQWEHCCTIYPTYQRQSYLGKRILFAGPIL
jgi:hypothetical protein